MKAALLGLALLLLSACVQPVRSVQIIGPTWPHGICDVVNACWPTDGAP